MRRTPALFLAAALVPVALAPAVSRAAEQIVDPVIADIVHNAPRSPKFIARDAARHPAPELSFFGLRPDATVVEIWPGGGYWSEILAAYLHGRGTYYIALPAGAGEEKEAAAFRARMHANPAFFIRAKITELGAGKTDIAPPGSADFVLTFRNVHNWMYDGTADANFAAFYKALKPGGILGVEEHRGRADKPQDPKAENGYVREDYTIALAEKAGFKLAGKSEINANPKDTKEWPQGVWTLPPAFALGAQDHAKYAAIGEADNFVLKFVK